MSNSQETQPQNNHEHESAENDELMKTLASGLMSEGEAGEEYEIDPEIEASLVRLLDSLHRLEDATRKPIV